MTFGHKVPKLNSRPVYCSRLYGTLILGQKACFLRPTIFEIPRPNWYTEAIFWSVYILFILFCRIHFINLKRVVKRSYILKPCNTVKAAVGGWRLCKKDSGHTRMNQGHGTHNARLFFEVHVVVVEQIGLFRSQGILYIWIRKTRKTSSFILITNQFEYEYFCQN